MDLFRRSKGSNGNGSGSSLFGPPTPSKSSSSSKSKKASRVPSLASTSEAGAPTTPPKTHLDDFGVRTDRAQPAFSSGSKREDFGKGYGVGEDDELGEIQQLIYGWAPVDTTKELPIGSCLDIAVRCSLEIRARGLDTPLIFSSMALDLTVEGTVSLIRSYLSGNRSTWLYDLGLAAPLNVGAFLKWGLGRLINDKGGRGFVGWESYSEFKAAEKAASYPPTSCTTHLLSRLPTESENLLSSLLSLFSSVSAYSSTNGMTPRKISSLFSPYVFGMDDDKSFDETYAQWQRATDAMEHMLLAFIRDQKATLASGQLPTHLEKFIIGYPAILNISYSSARPKVPNGARVEEVTRVRRLTRFHSRNLIQSAGTWDVAHCPDWSLFFPPSYSSLAFSTSSSPPLPIYTPHYKHLLNIRSNSHLDTDEDDGEMQRYKTVVERDWGKFGETGFKDVDQGKLEFDLTEGERSTIRAKRATMDWGTFADSGFGGRETFAPADLIFHQNISQRVQTWPTSQQALSERLRATEKMLPAFNFDTTPHEEARILIDSNFLETWADVLVSGGWARDELKESNFALVQWKSRTRDGELPRGRVTTEGETRTEDRWCLVEEFTPSTYINQIREGKKKPNKRVSFLRTVRRKSVHKSSPPRPDVTQISHPTISVPLPTTSFSPNSASGVPRVSTGGRNVDESVFSTSPGSTKMMTASNVDLAGRGSAYAPSTISTVGATQDHEVNGGHSMAASESRDERENYNRPVPSPRTLAQTTAYGFGSTMTSQTRESAFGGQGPVGFIKPPAKGFLARISSKRKTKTPPATPTTVATPGNPLSKGTTLPDSQRRASSPGRVSPVIVHPSVSSQAGPPPPPKIDPRDSTYSEEEGSLISEEAPEADDEDPYGGIADDSGTEEGGEVLFRGSRSYPKNLNEQELYGDHRNGSTPDRQNHGSPNTPVSIPQINIQAPSTKSSTRAVRRLPPAPVRVVYNDSRDSLPPSPKPDAEVPIDETHDRRNRYGSGSSVSRMAAKYENGVDTTRNVRLTQFGFDGPHTSERSNSPSRRH